MASKNINIVGQYLNTNQEVGYVVLDIKSDIDTTDDLQDVLSDIEGTIRTRVLY
jgi:D-3-phosphoglycerate dehydrogenase